MSASITPPAILGDLLIPSLRCFVLHEPGALRALARLTPTVRATVCLVVAGKSRKETRGERGVSRQRVHEDLHEAVLKLGIETRVPCAACLSAAVDEAVSRAESVAVTAQDDPNASNTPLVAGVRPVPVPSATPRVLSGTHPTTVARVAVFKALEALVAQHVQSIEATNELGLCVLMSELVKHINLNGLKVPVGAIPQHLFQLARAGLVVRFLNPDDHKKMLWTTAAAWKAWQAAHPR